MAPSFRIPFTILFLITITGTATAGWAPDGNFINALPPAGSEGPLRQAPDAAGGIFVSFSSNVQRVSPTGDLLLGPNGVNVALTSATGCVADGAGGVFIAGLAGTTIKLVRMNALGTVLWTSNVCTTANAKLQLIASSDGQNGALIAWSEARALPSPENARSLYMQRMNATGTALWTAEGVRVRYATMVVLGDNTVGTAVDVRDLCTSGNGGAFVSSSAQDSPNGLFDPISVHYVPAAGSGIAGIAGSNTQSISMLPDGSGGLYVCKFGGNATLTRTVPGGGNSWTVPVTNADPSYLVMAPSTNGALIAWQQNYDIYAQKVSAAGAAQWTDNGVPVCTIVGSQTEPAIATDFVGGAHIVWSDGRYSQRDLYKQHLDAGGAPGFTDYEGGEPFIDNANTEETRATLYTNPAGYAIVAWHRVDGNYANRYNFGTLTAVGPPAVASTLEQNHPNPFNPATTIAFSLAKAGHTSVDIFAVDGQHVRTLLNEHRGAGAHQVTWNGTDDAGQPVSSGVYLYKLRAGTYSATRKMVLLK